MKHTWLIILFALLTLQSTNAVLERHHIENSQQQVANINLVTESNHAKSPQLTQDKTDKSHDSEVDCNHCCHCHKVKPFNANPIRPYALPLAFQKQFIDQDELLQNQVMAGLYRPPKLLS